MRLSSHTLNSTIALVLLGAATLFLTSPPAVADVPFVPTPEETVRKMLEVANAGPDDVVYDLGSGDGRIVIAAVRDFGVKRAVGIELDQALVEDSRRNARAAGVADQAQFIAGNIFEEDFSEATVVTMYLLDSVNLRLRPRLLKELRPGTRIVSHQFYMAEWSPDLRTRGGGRPIYHWIIPANVAGAWRGEADGEEFQLELEQEFQKVSGTITVFQRRVPIENATLTGDALQFTARLMADEQPVLLQFSGRVDEGVVEAVWSTGDATIAAHAERLE
jgi:SAM-dependent methyltransferase